MNSRSYLLVSGSIFGLLAVLHLLRVMNGWDLVIGSWSAPTWATWLGILLPAALSAWAFRLVRGLPST